MRNRLIRLGPSQLVIMGAGLLTVLFALSQVEWPLWADVYARAYALPRMEERWGFRLGTIRAQRDGGEYYGIVSLTPDGRLARLGFRLHDEPSAFPAIDNWTGTLTLYGALLASERGEATTLYVVNLDDWDAGRRDLGSIDFLRNIDVQPVR